MKLATSYFGSRILRHVKADLADLRNLGFTRIVHTFSENDFFYSPDTMKAIVAASREAGFEVQIDPWGVAGIFGGEAFSRWIIETPSLMQRGASGRPLGGACLNNPLLLERMADWTDAAAATGSEWVFWDEPHWSPAGSPRNPEGEFCVCEHCREKAGEAGITESFRGSSLLDFLSRLVLMATERGMKSSICVLPSGTMNQPGLDWPRIASLPGLSEFGTDPYWQAFNIESPEARDRFIDANSLAAKQAAAANGLETMLWAQAFRIPSGREKDLLSGTDRLINHQPDTLAIWGFEACAHMSTLACDNPDVIWHGIIDLFRRRSRQ